MKLQLHDWVDQYIFVTGTYEDTTAEVICALLCPGDVGIDVGANIGFFSLLMAERVAPAGQVYSFEPCPDVRKRLIENVAINGGFLVQVRSEAISDSSRVQTLHAGTKNHSGIASLRPIAGSVAAVEVTAGRLDDLLPLSVVPRLIKVDVEGAEYCAMLGMLNILRKHKPDLVVEMSDHFLKQMGSSAVEVFDLLRNLGYSMYRIEWRKLVAYERWDLGLPIQFNALFTMRTALPRQLHLLLSNARAPIGKCSGNAQNI